VNRFSALLASLLRLLLRAVVLTLGAAAALVGLALMLGAAIFGVTVALVWLAWARLRGRPAPPVRFQWRQTWVHRGWSTRSPRAPEAGGAARHRGGEVVDVEVTERREPDARPPERLR